MAVTECWNIACFPGEMLFFVNNNNMHWVDTRFSWLIKDLVCLTKSHKNPLPTDFVRFCFLEARVKAKRTGKRSRGIQVRTKGHLEYLVICVCADEKKQQRSLRKSILWSTTLVAQNISKTRKSYNKIQRNGCISKQIDIYFYLDQLEEEKKCPSRPGPCLWGAQYAQ